MTPGRSRQSCGRVSRQRAWRAQRMSCSSFWMAVRRTTDSEETEAMSSDSEVEGRVMLRRLIASSCCSTGHGQLPGRAAGSRRRRAARWCSAASCRRSCRSSSESYARRRRAGRVTQPPARVTRWLSACSKVRDNDVRVWFCSDSMAASAGRETRHLSMRSSQSGPRSSVDER